MKGALADIRSVDLVMPPPPALSGAHVDEPKSRTAVEAGPLEVTGWVVGRGVCVERVEAARRHASVPAWPVDLERPDVAVALPGVAGAERSGFHGSIDIAEEPRQTRIGLHAVLGDGRRVHFASIVCSRGWRVSASPAERDLVSVVIPCFRQAHFLGEAIESARSQSYPHVEVVVVDDGSPDNAAAVASRYSGVRYIRQPNRGLAAARNTGIRHSNGDFLVFLDADDRLLPHALDAGLAALGRHPDAAFVSGHHRLVGIDGQHLSTSDIPCAETGTFADLLRRNYIAMHGSVMYRRAVFEDVKGFDESLAAGEDYDLYLRIAKKASFYCHHEVVADYRVHAANLTRRSALMLGTTLRILAAHGPDARRSAVSRSALASGRRYWRSYYGSPLVAEVRSDLARRRVASAAAGLAALARYHPAALARLVNAGFDRGC